MLLVLVVMIVLTIFEYYFLPRDPGKFSTSPYLRGMLRALLLKFH